MRIRSAAKLPGLDPGPASRRLRWPEEDTEAACDQGCAVHRWAVLSTVRRRKRIGCPHCGGWFMPGGGDGCTPGVPDRLIQPRELLAAVGPVWIGVELKGSDTPLSDAQRELEGQGRIAIARDWDDVDRVVREVLGRVRG
jgi:hypothetical protein